MPPVPIAKADAELLGVKVLGWISLDADRLGVFLGQSGLSSDELAARAAEPEMLGFVLDFLLGDEDSLVACCMDLGLPPDQPMRARASLPGGDLPHWT
ncbi:MAG: DUF3572 domain-containing protein [Pseudomonadota bacterium]